MELYIRKFVAKAIILTFFISAFAIPKITSERSMQGTTYDYGNIIVTEDGNMWEIEDAPEYEDGTKVVVAFNTKGTFNIKDDEIRRIDYDKEITKEN